MVRGTGLLLVVGLLGTSSALVGQAPSSATPSDDTAQCAALMGIPLPAIDGALPKVVTARLVDVPAAPPNASPQGSAAILAASPIKRYCQVTGYVAPQNKFELRLPLPASWNEKFFMVPCAAFCGTVDGSQCNRSLARGYASATMNGGHDSQWGFDGTWAAGAPNLQIDYGWRSVHVVTLATKAITTKYYGRAIQRAYIEGCSKGGQSVLSEVQRFPDDYDGAIAIAPVYDFAGQMAAATWWAQAVHDGTGSSLLDSTTMRLVHAVVLRECGSQSGVADGFVSDPLACGWRPQSIACSSGTATDCLSAKQVAAISRLMTAPADSKGRVLYGRQLPGAESNWPFWFYPGDGSRTMRNVGHFMAAEQFMSYMASATPRRVDPLQLRIDELPVTYTRVHQIYDATSPDLGRFKTRGGKLVLWHGLSDAAVPATMSINYYERVSRVMGGKEADSFLRLFLVPGVNHCGGGPGLDDVDGVTALENWVERGSAPAQLMTRRFANGVLERSRPVFPYPKVARYAGSGDPAQASSFVPGEPHRGRY
jgi:tannase/feruloyl esterase